MESHLLYTIGQTSLMTRLSIKTLRHYHEQGLLVPDHIDDETGYRYYRPGAVERAQVIRELRDLGLTLKQIGAILADCQSDDDLLEFLQTRAQAIAAEQKRLREASASIDQIITHIELMRSANAALAGEAGGQAAIREIPEQRILSLRTHGENGARWQDIGGLFRQLGRRAGRHIAGPPISLCYDDEYKESGADYEAAFPVRREIAPPKKLRMDCRVLPATRALCLLHSGSYQTISSSYAAIFQELQRQKLSTSGPSREIYLKGPGMIFRGNPANYRTEIQLPLVW